MENLKQWPRVKEIVGRALELEPSRRVVYVEKACSENPGLRAEVESLLAAYSGSNALPDFVFDPQLVTAEEQPKAIGAYRLVRELGVGGMGLVWLAEQTEPVQRHVALKLIRAGMYDSSTVERFKTERQSLAMMDHPAIAKVFDAGMTSAGQPYLVMEYVDGIPITAYCDTKRLSITERLILFIRVCEGVQHAHQKAIIHRDLKPSNILVIEVDGKPTPHIIDFGLAKAAAQYRDVETLLTRAGTLLGTPGYISPEQLDPEMYDIDTRADVYSLGVVLYELLTGVLPFDTTVWKGERLDEALRQLRDMDPPRPSTRAFAVRDPSIAVARSTQSRQLVASLRGDLDWMTMKALEKDRERRYGTPAELAADIERYLDSRPVTARPPRTGYRLRKCLRRNRLLVSAIAASFAVLIAFAVTQTVQLRRTTRERDRADRITQFMTSMFEVSDPSEARGNTVTAREILDKASKDIEIGLIRNPEAQAQMMEVMGEVYDSLGLDSRAELLLSRAVETRRRILGISHPETLKSMDNLAWVLFQEGRAVESEKLQRQALKMRRQVLGPRDKGTLASMVNLASALNPQGRFGEAEILQREALEILRQTRGPENEDTLTCMSNLANTLSWEHKYAEAETLRRENLDIRRRVLGSDSPDTLSSMLNLADTLYLEGQYPEAEKLERETLDIQRHIEGPEHPETLLTMYNLACVLNRTGRYKEAETIGRTTLEVRRRVLGPQHPKTLLAMVSLAMSLLEQDQFPEAKKLLKEAIDVQQRVLGPNNPDTAASVYELAILEEHEGHYDNALNFLHEALDHGLSPSASLSVETDPDLKSLQRDPRFTAFVAETKRRAADQKSR